MKLYYIFLDDFSLGRKLFMSFLREVEYIMNIICTFIKLLFISAKKYGRILFFDIVKYRTRERKYTSHT